MTRVKIELLEEELAGLQLAAGHLQYSMERCQNLIAHEYATEKMLEIYGAVTTMAPVLLAVVPKVIAYANNTIRKYPK